jgi:5'-nucleotidase / UDP-sugar diphosphatase
VRSRHSRAIGAALAVAATVAAAAPPQTPPQVVPRSLELPKGVLLAPGPAADVDVLATGGVIGYIEDCGCKHMPAGGLSRRGWLVGQLRAKFPETPFVLLDTGNFSDNPTAAGERRTRLLLDSMVQLGYKVAGLGERDLVSGYDDFKKRTEGLDLTFVSTNIIARQTGEPAFAPYTIVEVAGRDGSPIRVGVLAVARYNPLWQKSGPDGTDLIIDRPAPRIARYLPEVRRRSDVVVLLAGLARDDAHALVAPFPDVDLMLDAYGAIVTTVEEREGPTRVVLLGNQGQRIAENRIVLGANRRPSDVLSTMYFLTDRYPDDPAMKEAVEKLNAELAAAAGDASKTVPPKPQGSEAP